MSVAELPGLVDVIIARKERDVVGRTLTKPALLYTDGSSVTYAVDVQIEGQRDRLRNVPLAPAAEAVYFAQVGSAVMLRRVSPGRYEVVGYAKSRPANDGLAMVAVAVGICSGQVGADTSEGYWTHIIQLGELKDYGGGFGVCPFGAYALMQGSTLIELRVLP